MLSRVRISGYKSINDVSLNLNNFTLLSGVNSAGKSSVIQGILYAAKAGQIFKNSERRFVWKWGLVSRN